MNWGAASPEAAPDRNYYIEMLIAIATSFRAELFGTQYLL